MGNLSCGELIALSVLLISLIVTGGLQLCHLLVPNSELGYALLVPVWKLFAPHPSRNLHLIWRLRLSNKNYRPWVEVRVVSTQTIWSFAWDPHKYRNAALYAVMSCILRSVRCNDQHGEKMRMFCRIVLASIFVDTPIRDADSEIQFAVIGMSITEPMDPPEVLFVSDLFSTAIEI